MDLVNDTHRQDLARHIEKNAPGERLEDKIGLRDIRNQFINIAKNYPDTVDNQLVDINDQSVAELILNAIADSDKKKILDATLYKSKTPIEILDICKIPPTSGYRKIKSLIKDSLLIPTGTFRAHGKKAAGRYISALENIRINIDKGNIVVKVKFTKI